MTQDELRIGRYARLPDGSWQRAEFADPAGAFALASVPAEVPVADIDSDVVFPPAPGRPV